MAIRVIKNQIPRTGSILGGSRPRANNEPISNSSPLVVGEVVDTTYGRGEVVAISGNNATIRLEYTSANVTLDARGISGADFSLHY